MVKRMWCVGRNIDKVTTAQAKLVDKWDFGGVFTTERKAVAACRDYTYFVGPVKVNEQLPEMQMEWPGCYYPIPRPLQQEE